MFNFQIVLMGIFLALCEIEWVIKFQFAAKEINHVDEVSRIAVAPRTSFG